jgi:hypothetical protein
MLESRPKNRRAFKSTWDEIIYRGHKAEYWFYRKGSPRNAARHLPRLAVLLRRHDPMQQALIGQRLWALLFEARGDLRKAMKHRQEEIRMIKVLGRSTLRQKRGMILLGRMHGYPASFILGIPEQLKRALRQRDLLMQKLAAPRK